MSKQEAALESSQTITKFVLMIGLVSYTSLASECSEICYFVSKCCKVVFVIQKAVSKDAWGYLETY